MPLYRIDTLSPLQGEQIKAGRFYARADGLVAGPAYHIQGNAWRLGRDFYHADGWAWIPERADWEVASHDVVRRVYVVITPKE